MSMTSALLASNHTICEIRSDGQLIFAFRRCAAILWQCHAHMSRTTPSAIRRARVLLLTKPSKTAHGIELTTGSDASA